MTGKVYLVGAGPGDPELITIRGAKLLAKAQVVVYDHLVNPELLALTDQDCRLIDAGKRAENHTLDQASINSLLVAEAQKGLLVVRLKGGDPYVFGRGGEEALFLAAAGVEFEVVSGVSSTIAVANAAGIPLTHRGLSSQATLLTGHGQDGLDIDFSTLAKDQTLSIVMGRKNLDRIRANLMAAGHPPSTLAAVIENGSTAAQKTVVGTLADLAEKVERAGLKPPTLLVVGAVVGLRDQLNWFENRPLFGKTILVTRTSSQASSLADPLRELGAKVLERPAIKIVANIPNEPLIKALGEIDQYRYLVFTSPNAVHIFFEILHVLKLDARFFGHRLQTVAIGPGTEKELAAHGLLSDFKPSVYQAEGLIEIFKNLPQGPVLLPRSAKARKILPQSLNQMGFPTNEIKLYATEPIRHFLEPTDQAEVATLTSASVAKSLAEALEPQQKELPTISIGPITTQAAREVGLKVVAESPKASIPSLVETIRQYFSPQGGQ
ncbi:MAG: uroporphyrinogen-III C-methyltransferase [Deltaproteobacteria bacterium]|jgi:uroporphyrinogen III methyltransferase/synthase|nr:uroporphyrinogen-III C-methyltransferase [Deltaproteobacteria bacterium]